MFFYRGRRVPVCFQHDRFAEFAGLGVLLYLICPYSFQGRQRTRPWTRLAGYFALTLHPALRTIVFNTVVSVTRVPDYFGQ